MCPHIPELVVTLQRELSLPFYLPPSQCPSLSSKVGSPKTQGGGGKEAAGGTQLHCPPSGQRAATAEGCELLLKATVTPFRLVK